MKTINNQPSARTTCICGQALRCIVSPHMTAEKRVCPACGRIYYVDHAAIDWARATGERNS